MGTSIPSSSGSGGGWAQSWAQSVGDLHQAVEQAQRNLDPALFVNPGSLASLPRTARTIGDGWLNSADTATPFDHSLTCPRSGVWLVTFAWFGGSTYDFSGGGGPEYALLDSYLRDTSGQLFVDLTPVYGTVGTGPGPVSATVHGCGISIARAGEAFRGVVSASYPGGVTPAAWSVGRGQISAALLF